MATKTKVSGETLLEVGEPTLGGVEVTEEPLAEIGGGAEIKTADAKTRMYLLSVLTKDASSALTELTALVLSAGSKVEKAEDLGPKRLAFPINGHHELTLVSVFFGADGQTVKALADELKHAETIERYLLSTWRAGLEEPKRRQAERQKREQEKNV